MVEKKAIEKKKHSTDLLWSIANLQNSEKEHKVQEILDIAEEMIPGYDVWWSQTNKLAREILKPEIEKQHPKLTEFKSSSEAVTALGETLEVDFVKKCNGYEWMEWSNASPSMY